MSRLYDRITVSGRIAFTEDFATRASTDRGVPINLDVPLTIDTQDDPLLLELLSRQRQANDAALLRWYAEHDAMASFAF